MRGHLQPCPCEGIAVMYQELPPIQQQGGAYSEVLWAEALADDWCKAWPGRLSILHQDTP